MDTKIDIKVDVCIEGLDDTRARKFREALASRHGVTFRGSYIDPLRTAWEAETRRHLAGTAAERMAGDNPGGVVLRETRQPYASHSAAYVAGYLLEAFRQIADIQNIN